MDNNEEALSHAKAKRREAHGHRVGSIIETLMTLGLPDPRPVELQIASHPVTTTAYIPIRSAGTSIPVELDNVAPSDVLLAIFDRVYRAGFKDGHVAAEAEQVDGLLAAFPRLKDLIRDVAIEVTDARVGQIEDRREGRQP